MDVSSNFRGNDCGGSSGAFYPGIRRCAGPGARRIPDAAVGRRGAELCGRSDVEGLAVWLSEADLFDAQIGGSLPGTGGFDVADGHAGARSYIAMAFLE